MDVPGGEARSSTSSSSSFLFSIPFWCVVFCCCCFFCLSTAFFVSECSMAITTPWVTPGTTSPSPRRVDAFQCPQSRFCFSFSVSCLPSSRGWHAAEKAITPSASFFSSPVALEVLLEEGMTAPPAKRSREDGPSSPVEGKQVGEEEPDGDKENEVLFLRIGNGEAQQEDEPEERVEDVKSTGAPEPKELVESGRGGE